MKLMISILSLIFVQSAYAQSELPQDPLLLKSGNYRSADNANCFHTIKVYPHAEPMTITLRGAYSCSRMKYLFYCKRGNCFASSGSDTIELKILSEDTYIFFGTTGHEVFTQIPY